jgi:predicted flap endonuclease-1-like 5' DNA nuclease
MTFDTTTIGIIVAVLAVLILGFLIMRPKKAPPRVERREAEPYVASTERPYVKAAKDGPEGNGVADEVAAATTDVAGEVLGVEAHRELAGASAGAADDLAKLKGVGPKMVARLSELGITRYAQIAGFNETELAHLDERMGPFKGRLARDRVAEQADYLARGDVDGFEEKFGKLGG